MNGLAPLHGSLGNYEFPYLLRDILYARSTAPKPELGSAPIKLVNSLTFKQREVTKRLMQGCLSVVNGQRSERDYALVMWLKKLNLGRDQAQAITNSIGRKFKREDYFPRMWDNNNS